MKKTPSRKRRTLKKYKGRGRLFRAMRNSLSRTGNKVVPYSSPVFLSKIDEIRSASPLSNLDEDEIVLQFKEKPSQNNTYKRRRSRRLYVTPHHI